MADSAVTTVDAGPRKVARQVVVNTSPGAIFALVSDPRHHGELDGSGSVGDAVSAPEKLSVGAKFSMSMKMYGVPYRITSTVTAFEQDRLLEWRHPLGHSWRWELAEATPGQTQVTETFDYSGAKAGKVLELVGVPKQNGSGITRTLDKLRERFAH